MKGSNVHLNLINHKIHGQLQGTPIFIINFIILLSIQHFMDDPKNYLKNWSSKNLNLNLSKYYRDILSSNKKGVGFGGI